MENCNPPDLRRIDSTTRMQLGNRRLHVAGLQVAGEQNVELFSLEDLHRDPLFQNNDNAQHASGDSQAPLQGRQRSDCSMELDDDVEAQQPESDAQAHNPNPDDQPENARMQEEENQALVVHRPPSSPAVDSDEMEADHEIDEEIGNLRFEQDADLSEKYPVVSSPGSSHSSKRSTPSFEANRNKEICFQLERAELERIELDICRSEEDILMKSLERSICLAEESHLLNSLEVHISDLERQLEKRHNTENPNTIIKAALNVPRLLPKSRKLFITAEFLAECTKSFEQECENIANETTFKTYLLEVARRPQTWKLCVEGPKESVKSFFVHWGNCFRTHVKNHTVTELRRDGIEIVLKLDPTQSLGVRVENVAKQPGLLVLKRDDGFKGQLADIVSPDNLAAGALILSADGILCRNASKLRECMESVAKRGARDIHIKLCLSRSIDLKRIDHTAVVSLEYRSSRETIPLPPVERNHNDVSTMNQPRSTTEDSRRREKSLNDATVKPRTESTLNAEENSTAPDWLSKKRKDQSTVMDAQSRKRVRNDRHIDTQADAPFASGQKKMYPVNGDEGPSTHDTRSHCHSRAARDQQSDRQFGRNDQRNLTSIKSNRGLNEWVPRKGVAHAHDSSILNRWTPTNSEPKKATTQPPRNNGLVVDSDAVGLRSTNSSTGRVGWGAPTEPPQVEAAVATADRRTNVYTSQESSDAKNSDQRTSGITRIETEPPVESAIINSLAYAHIDTENQETFSTKFDSDLPLGFYCIYDRTTPSCRVVSVCPTGQASQDERIQPGTKLIGIRIKQMQAGRSFEIQGVANDSTSQNHLAAETQASDKKLDESSYKDEVDGKTGVRHIWGPQDLKNHLLAARTKRVSIDVWFANDSDNPYFISFKGRFREAQWGDEGEWKGPNFAGWDGVLQPEAFLSKRNSPAVPVATRTVHFSDRNSIRRFFRDKNTTIDCTSIANDEHNGSIRDDQFDSLKDALSRGSVYDVIEFIRLADRQDIGDTRRNEKRETLTIKYFTEARSMTRQNTCTDADTKDKLLKICARMLRAVNLARAFRFWERFDIHVVGIRNLRLPHSIKHDNCSIYLEADLVSASDKHALQTSPPCAWNPRFIDIPGLIYPVSFNKYVETNRKTLIRIMVRHANSDITTCVSTVEITESDLSQFKADSKLNDYTRTASTIIGEAFCVDFRVSRTSTPDEKRKKLEALKYIQDGANAIQFFNKHLDESRGVKLSMDMHFSTEKHLTLLHAAIALYDVPTVEKVLAAGANPFLKTPLCSPFVMAQQKVEHLAGAIDELQQRQHLAGITDDFQHLQQRLKQIEEMIVLMRKFDSQRLANQDTLHVEEVTPEVEDNPESLVPDSGSLSQRDQMSVSEQAKNDPVTPILSQPNWLDMRVQKFRLCRNFEASQTCPRYDLCTFIHRHKSFGDHLPHVLEKSQDHPIPDHVVDCIQVFEERDSTGKVWFTSGYLNCTKMGKKVIYYAEGGQSGVRSSQNVWWYPTKADAMIATCRVMAAYDWATFKGDDIFPHCRQTRVDMEVLADTWTHLTKRKNGFCKHWPRCNKNDHHCDRFHGYGPFDEPGDKTKKGQIDRSRGAVPYDIRMVARRDVREGRLYHTARYRHPDDKGLRYLHNYNGEGFYDSRNGLFWFESEEQVRAAIASGK